MDYTYVRSSTRINSRSVIVHHLYKRLIWHFVSQSTMQLMYLSLVRSRLEYCSTVWSPFYSNSFDQIERTQNKFTKMFYFKFRIAHPRPPYDERLKHLKMRSLETRSSTTTFRVKLNFVKATLTASKNIARCCTLDHSPTFDYFDI